MGNFKRFEVVYLKEAVDFLLSLPQQARSKIDYNIRKVSGGVIDSELFKKLEGANDLWEFRTKYNGIQYRLLAFGDDDTKHMVVATHGFIKKVWRVPGKEISRAEDLKRMYYENKIRNGL